MNDSLNTIDMSTGALSGIGAPGFVTGGQTGGKIAIFKSVLYGSLEFDGGGHFGTFNTGDGSFSTIADNGLFKEMNIFTDGTTLYGLTSNAASTNSLYTIDPDTGTVTLDKAITGSNIPNYWSGASFAPAVPEPSTYALLCISLGMVGIARKKMGKREA